MSRHTLIIRRRLKAAPNRVFEALTDPAQIAQWLIGAPKGKAEVEADVRVGGRYKLRMEEPDGTSYEPHGEYLAIDPPRKLVFTWSCKGYCQNSVVTFELHPADGETDLVLSHVLPDDGEIVSAHDTGWTWCLRRLEKLVTTNRNEPHRKEHP